nr:ABC transporter permease [Xanthomonas sp. XNM01]
MIVLSIAVGIGTSMTVLTVLHVLSGDPIPAKSARLFHVQLDPEPADGYQPGSEPMDLLTRIDAETLLQQKRGLRQAMMAGGSGTVDADGSAHRPLRVPTRHTSADFFPMFDTPFVHGQAWSAEQDAGRARVAVIGPALNARLFGMGIALGMLLAFALNQLLMVHYALPRLPAGYLPAGALLLWAIGQLAVYWPARRAASIPPAVATRSA